MTSCFFNPHEENLYFRNNFLLKIEEKRQILHIYIYILTYIIYLPSENLEGIFVLYLDTGSTVGYRASPDQGRVRRVPIDDAWLSRRIGDREREFGGDRLVCLQRFRYAVLVLSANAEVVLAIRLEADHVVVGVPYETTQFHPVLKSLIYVNKRS